MDWRFTKTSSRLKRLNPTLDGDLIENTNANHQPWFMSPKVRYLCRLKRTNSSCRRLFRLTSRDISYETRIIGV